MKVITNNLKKDAEVKTSLDFSKSLLDAIIAKTQEIALETKDDVANLPKLEKASELSLAKLKHFQLKEMERELAFQKSMVEYLRGNLSLSQAKIEAIESDYALEMAKFESEKADVYLVGYGQGVKDATIINAGIDITTIEKISLVGDSLNFELKLEQ